MIKSTIKSKIATYIVAILFLSLVGCSPKPDLRIQSPDEQLSVIFKVDDKGRAIYQIFSGDLLVLNWSPLGMEYSDGAFTSGLKLKEATASSVYQDDYQLLQGKKSDISYKANERTFVLSNGSGSELGITFRVSNDGVAFRYQLPQGSHTITNELTAYNFPKSTKMYVQPMSVAKSGWQQSNPSYEEAYEQAIPVNKPSTLGAGWVYPSLFNTADHWVLVTEADLGRHYCGSRLEADTTSQMMKVVFPSDLEVYTGGGALPSYSGTAYSPWRILTIGSLETIVESTLGTDLAAKGIEMDGSYIQPGFASWSWALLKDNSVNFETSKQFIDYASEMTWSYCLIDVNWDTQIGEEKIKELVAYAEERNVGLILWYNSAGEWNTTPYHPKSALLTHEQRLAEFGKLQEWGVKGVKIDFFGGDGQSMIAYYHDILKDAAEFNLLVNFHGATLPRGWHRTYPHLMTVEAIKGFEFITFTQEVADVEAKHSAMLPFTRNAFDPMDFTPMCFSKIPNIDRKTTNAFELALPSLFLSGIQHIAEVPSGMDAVPDYVRDYLKDIPVSWDETQFIDGFPGKLAVVARRAGDTWYVTGINGEGIPKKLSLDLSFLSGKAGLLITDGEAHPEFRKEEISIDGVFNLGLKANGGFIIKLK